MITTTDRDLLVANAVTANVSTFAVASQWPQRVSTQDTRPTHLDYLVSDQLITTLPHASAQSVSILDQRDETVVSPMWLGRLKRRLKEVAQLSANWDSYGAVPVDPRILRKAADLVEWFAVADMPPPDVFATPEGGVQLEWHIRRVNIEVEMSPFEGTTLYFHDLNAGELWSRLSSETDLQTIRRRLLTPV